MGGVYRRGFIAVWDNPSFFHGTALKSERMTEIFNEMIGKELWYWKWNYCMSDFISGESVQEN